MEGAPTQKERPRRSFGPARPESSTLHNQPSDYISLNTLPEGLADDRPFFILAERVGLLAAGDGRSSSASLRTDAFASSKIAPRFCRTRVGSSTHPAPPK
jgi:hypothetical protein